MDRNSRKVATMDGTDGSPPTAAWLFAQAIQGKPIPNAFRAKAEARAKREQLEWLASISSRHEEQLRKLLNAEAEARHQCELLEWLATISEEHEWKLRTLLREEAEAREAQQIWEQYTENQTVQEAWDPSKHPRQGGPPNPGWWAPAGGGTSSGAGLDRSGSASQSDGAGHHDATPAMLELAHAWWQTNNVLQQSHRDIERLPALIASEHAKLGSHDGYSHVHAQNLAKASRDLAIAKAHVPQLEAQLRDLEQQYHDSGYDHIEYST